MAIRAIIYDMDDTLVRTTPLWRAAETALLNFLGRPWSPELAVRYKGMNAGDVANVVYEHVRPPTVTLAECQRVIRDALLTAFQTLPAEPMPGAVDLVRMTSSHWPTAVASGSPIAAIRLALSRCGIEQAFDHLITSESVPRGKPHPDVFLAAAKALDVGPESCLVMEDTLIGAQAARAAGMACFVVPSMLPPADQLQVVATRMFASLADIKAADIEVVAGRGSSMIA